MNHTLKQLQEKCYQGVAKGGNHNSPKKGGLVFKVKMEIGDNKKFAPCTPQTMKKDPGCTIKQQSLPF